MFGVSPAAEDDASGAALELLGMIVVVVVDDWGGVSLVRLAVPIAPSGER